VAFGTPIVLLLWFYLVFMGILIGAGIEAQLKKVAEPPRPNPLVLPHWLNALLAPALAKVGLEKIASPKLPEDV
jgi:uncharacterized BrkB/YihY/UPF0761 family membrane protein